MISLKKSKTFLYVSFIALILISKLFADDTSEYIRIRAEGYAEGPSYLVKQLALAEAQRNAIEQYLRSILSEKYLSYLTPLLNKSSLYIQSYKILNENTEKDRSSIELDVEINDDLINKDVATFLIPHVTDLPEISIYFVDIPSSDNSPYLESKNSFKVIEEKLKNLKFTIKPIDKENFKNDNEIEQLIKEGLESKKKIALCQKADVFVLGCNQYEILDGSFNNQLLKVRCNLTVELFRVSDGKMLDAFTVSASVQGKNFQEAQIQSAEDCALKSIQKIITSAFLSSLNYENNPKDIHLYFVDFEDKTVIKKMIDYLETVTSGCKIELVFETPKKTKYLLHFDGPIVYIVDSISNNREFKNVAIQKVVEREIYMVPTNSQ